MELRRRQPSAITIAPAESGSQYELANTISEASGNSDDTRSYYYTFAGREQEKLAKPYIPSIRIGFLILVLTMLFLFLGSYAVLFSAFLPSTGLYLLDLLAGDAHYKYFLVLLVPTGAYFVIANWVGWQYYRNS